MQFWITKSGLEIFDVARAYGLAALLSFADEDQSSSPEIKDVGTAYRINLPNGKPSLSRLKDRGNTGWLEAFTVGDFRDPLSAQWNCLFITDTAGQRETKRFSVQSALEKFVDDLRARESVALVPKFDGEETLPGALDPTAFKGLRGRTRGQYSEGQTKVDRFNWALGCVGGALAGRFVYQRNAGYFVLYPMPESVKWTDFRELRQETYGERLNYLSVQNAAAHYSVVLAERLRQRAASGLSSTPRYSNILYFSLFKTGNQWKPGTAGHLNLQPLLELATQRPNDAEGVFNVWRYLFRRGSVRGNEDLALAITDFIMHPTLTTYERHVRVFTRYIARGTTVEFQYSEQSLKEVTALVSSQ
ncbi:MAG TPA: hypothetical protein VNN77_20160 [candidate division Zixibacteria bacterium]|nr:hypothetical protein [candidate division Zixibacteria bacterium]